MDKSPGKSTEEELREYFLHLKNEHAFSAGSMKVAYCGVKFFFTFTLKREWSTLALVRARKEVRLPVVLAWISHHEMLVVRNPPEPRREASDQRRTLTRPA